jgi:branched-subunit amino acid transport protein AzlD
MSVAEVILSISLMAAVILFTRALPFLFLRKKQPPGILNYLEQNIPPLIMLLLVIYCIKDVKWDQSPYGLPELVGIGVVALLHIWKNNALLSIVSGTIVYMVAIRFL